MFHTQAYVLLADVGESGLIKCGLHYSNITFLLVWFMHVEFISLKIMMLQANV